MKINYNIPKIEKILTDISVLVGLQIDFLDNECNLICGCSSQKDYCCSIQKNNEMQKKCSKCDSDILKRCLESRDFEYHICHAGLYDAAMPIIKDGIIVGVIIMGRVRSSKSPQKPKSILNASDIQLYNKLPFFTDLQIESLKSLLPNILFENAITIEYNDILDRITEYIKNDLTNELSINFICNRFHISKNNLYALFGEHYGVTVNDYIISVRIKTAKEILQNSQIPVYIVAERVGINNYTYFCRLFKKHTGMTPSQYRKAVDLFKHRDIIKEKTEVIL